MVFQKFKGINDLETKILVPITWSSNTVILDTWEWLKWWSAFPIKWCFISFDSQNRIVKKEVINVTWRTDDILSITRAVEKCKTSYNATTLENIAFSFDNWDYLFNFISAWVFDDINDEIMNKQATLISWTNIKRINWSSILWYWDLSVSWTWGSIGWTLTNQTDLSNALNGKQANLISWTNIKSVNWLSILWYWDLSTKDFGGYGGLWNVTISTNTVIDVWYSIHPCFEYDNLTINAWVTLSFTNCSWKIVWIKVRWMLANNWTISNNWTNNWWASSFIWSYNNAGSSNGSGSRWVARNTFNLNDHSVLNVMQWWAGGGSTYWTSVSGGGGGWAIIIEAHFINNAWTISCNWNNGWNWSAGWGGGGWWQIYLIYNVITWNWTYSAIWWNGWSGTSTYSWTGGWWYGAWWGIVPTWSNLTSPSSNWLNYYADSLAPPWTKNTNWWSGSSGWSGGGWWFIYFKKNNWLIM